MFPCAQVLVNVPIVLKSFVHAYFCVVLLRSVCEHDAGGSVVTHVLFDLLVVGPCILQISCVTYFVGKCVA